MSTAIDWMGAGDAPRLQAFIDEHWRPGHVLARDADLLRWQYRHPARPDDLSVLGATEEGELVGFLGLVLVDLALAGERVPGAWLAMWQATPEARTRRVGLALLLEVMRMPFGGIGCLGMNETAVRIYASLGFGVVPRLPRWVRPLAAEPLASLAPGFAAGAGTADEVEPDPGAFDDERAARWDDTWRTLAQRLDGTWRDSGYLRRRYLDHPRFRYEVRLPADGSALLVYRVEQVRDRPERVVRVLECLGPAERLAAAMLAEHDGAAFADFTCTDPTAARALERVGFVREDELSASLPDRFQPLEPAGRGLNGAFRLPGAAGALYCTRSDGDQDRPS